MVAKDLGVKVNTDGAVNRRSGSLPNKIGLRRGGTIGTVLPCTHIDSVLRLLHMTKYV
jgi:hypothetical protein